MYSLFDNGNNYIMPNGSSITGEDLANRDGYEILKALPCVLDLTPDGMIKSIISLGSFCEENHVEYDGENLEDCFEKAVREHDSNTLFEYDTLKSFNVIAKYAALSVPDEIALEVPDLYPVWAPNTEYEQNERITYNGQLCKVAQKHTSQDTDGWRPGETGSAALYSAVTIGSSGHDQWKMPTGAHDAYNMDDIVEYNGKLYQSKMDGNTTIPGQSRFWVEYTE